MSKKSENAVNLYLRAIRDGEIGAVDELTGDRYTQHSTDVKDGIEGFKEFFKGFLKSSVDRDIRVIRTIEDGNFVFVHVYQDINEGAAKWVTTDLFDTDNNDELIEHWDVISAYIDPKETASNNDMILGNFELQDLDKTEDNKAIVRNFIVDILQNRNDHNLSKYISEKTYIQHNPNIPNGIDAIKTFLTTQNFSYDFVFKVIGQGNHVMSYSKVIFHDQDQEFAVFDIFRVENGLIVEHWDNMEPIPNREKWVNTGKF